MKKQEERKEAFIRNFVLIISGIILAAWRSFIYVLVIINLVYTLVAGKRLRELAELSEVWNTQLYIFQRYIIFVSNRRPFPFGKLKRRMSEYETK